MHLNDGRVVSNFIVQALQNQPITVYGDGSQSRSFCYVSDLVSALELMMESAEDVTGPVNLGNPVEVSIRHLAERIIEKTGANSEIIEKPLPSDDPTRRCPDITRARSELGWSPSIDLDEGLDVTIAYFEKVLAAQNSK
jgi:UDP-glucuronate decarboxylase